MVTKKQILARIDELTNFIKSDEYNRLKSDSEELKRLKSLLSHIKFKIKDVNFYEDDNIVQVRYELPTINLIIDEEGNPNKNEFFRSANMLELVSLEDMNKVLNVLNKIKQSKILERK